jgi:16S rRNA (guanine527-N7)-methyltransferase
MKESPEAAVIAADWAGLALCEEQLATLSRYSQWLIEEGMAAGGLGPREGERIWRRHLADSLTFAKGWEGGSPSEILDVGTGVGLPGIPLAIAFPECTVTLLDRAGRRISLLHRVVRILGLPNVVIEQADIFAVADEWAGLVFRGAVKAAEAVGLTARLLADAGVAVLGVSARSEVPEHGSDLVGIASALGLEAELVEVPENNLDGGAWLLMMRSRG